MLVLLAGTMAMPKSSALVWDATTVIVENPRSAIIKTTQGRTCPQSHHAGCAVRLPSRQRHHEHRTPRTSWGGGGTFQQRRRTDVCGVHSWHLTKQLFDPIAFSKSREIS